MKLFFGRCLTAWLALAFSLPALPQQATQITPVEVQFDREDPKKGSGSTTQNNTLQLPGNFSLTPSAKPTIAPANNNLTVSSGVPSTRWGVVGTLKSTCGGLNANGSLQDPCGPTPAKFEAEAGVGCPAGAFAGQGSCWTCPQGFTRNVAHKVDGERACSRPDSSVPADYLEAQFGGKRCPDGSILHVGRMECWACPAGFERTVNGLLADNACVESDGPRAQAQRSAAKFVQAAKCQPGEFLDPRNGGECWSCPGASARTTFPVAGGQACRSPGGVRFANAAQGEVRICAPGLIHDAAGSQNAGVANRIRAQFGGNVPPEVLQTLGKSTHGTCWSCPADTKRSWLPVWNDKACRAQAIGIEPAQYVHPGLFGLAGAEQVALALTRERTQIETIARAIASQTKQSDAAAVRDTWDDIARAPQSSLALQVALLARIQAAAAEPQKASADEQRLLASFAAAIQIHRTYLAQSALDAYDLWFRTDQLMRSQRNANNLISLFDYGVPPPDLEAISAAGILGAVGAHAGTGAALAAIYGNSSLHKLVFPFRRVTQKAAVKGAEKIAEKVAVQATKMSVRVAVDAASKGASSVLAAIGSAGPQIIITAAVELIAISIEQIIDIATARPKLETKLRIARSPVDIARLLQTGEGDSEIGLQWSMAMTNNAAGGRASEFAALAAANAAAPAAPVAAVGAKPPGAVPAPRFSIVANDGARCLTAQPAGTVALAACGSFRWISSADGTALQVPDTNLCLTTDPNGTAVSATNCTTPRAPNQSWQFNPAKGSITSTATQRCLDLAANGGVTQNACDGRNPPSPTQRWAVKQ